MNRRQGSTETAVKTGRMTEAVKRYGVGKTTMRRLAAEAGAAVKVGRSYLIDFGVMDRYMDTMREKQEVI